MKNTSIRKDAPLYVISDLHLGSGRRDSFKDPARIRELMGFLDHIEKEDGRLIVLGDFFDLWRFKLSSIIKTHPDILQRFSEMDCIYVPGNHDRNVINVPKELRNKFLIFDKVAEPFSIDIGGRDFIFCHGHEVDNLNKFIKPSLGKVLGHLAIGIEHFASKQVFDSDHIRSAIFEAEAAIAAFWSTMMFGINRFITESLTVRNLTLEMLKHQHNIKTINRYKNFLEKSHTVVNAHTHRAGCFRDCYFNTGSWAMGNSDFVRILPDGVVDVLKWVGGKARKNETLLA
jgi:UDP-2,3-diacylglucosamine pyrophosphatase LpxH